MALYALGSGITLLSVLLDCFKGFYMGFVHCLELVCSEQWSSSLLDRESSSVVLLFVVVINYLRIGYVW